MGSKISLDVLVALYMEQNLHINVLTGQMSLQDDASAVIGHLVMWQADCSQNLCSNAIHVILLSMDILEDDNFTLHMPNDIEMLPLFWLDLI